MNQTLCKHSSFAFSVVQIDIIINWCNASVTAYRSTEIIILLSEMFWDPFVLDISTHSPFWSKSNALPWLRGAMCVTQSLLQQQCHMQVPGWWLLFSHHHIRFGAPLCLSLLRNDSHKVSGSCFKAVSPLCWLMTGKGGICFAAQWHVNGFGKRFQKKKREKYWKKMHSRK